MELVQDLTMSRMHEGWKLGKKKKRRWRFRGLPERVQHSLLAVSNAIDDTQGTETLVLD